MTNGLDYDGEYTCVATNIIGSTDKGIAIVDIQGLLRVNYFLYFCIVY